MQEYRHTLHTEFPEYKEKIHQLKISDAHFAKISDEYDEIDQKIHRIETGAEPESDAYTEDLKKKRLALKDEIFHFLNSKS